MIWKSKKQNSSFSNTHHLSFFVRFENMQVPASMSEKQRSILKENLRTVQKCLHSVNPFINDFKQILEIPSSENMLDGNRALNNTSEMVT